MNKIIFLSCALMCGVTIWMLSDLATSDSDSIPMQISQGTHEEKSVEIFQTEKSLKHINPYEILFDSIVKISEAKKLSDNIFGDDEKLKAAGGVLDKCMRYLNRDRAVTNFRASGYDTLDNYSASLEEFLLPYEEEPKENFLRKRVTALRFLEMSQHLSVKDCIGLLDHLAGKLHHASEQIQKNIRLDLYELSQACGRLDKDITASLANNLIDEKARNTILFGLERINENI